MALKDYYEQANFVVKKTVPDGLGGFEVELSIGEPFQALISMENPTQQLIAQQQGLKTTYSITSETNLLLERDDKIFFKDMYLRVINYSKQSPKVATIQTWGGKLEIVEV